MKSDSAATAASSLSSAVSIPEGPWWKQLNRYHWFVFLVASLAWLFDCLDQQLFILARNSAITALSTAGTDPVLIKKAGSTATAIFVAGWAMGGLIFGAVGDRIGRARTLTLTVLMYSLFTGLRYNPTLDTWVDLGSASGTPPAARFLHTAVWTGTEMIVWGGMGPANLPLNTGGRYNVAGDSWAAGDIPLTLGGAPGVRFDQTE